MSLYHEAAAILTAAQTKGGSLKTHIFSPPAPPSKKQAQNPEKSRSHVKTPSKSSWKSDPKTLFALTASTAQLSSVLAPIIQSAELLRHERQLSPVLALLLVHDLLFAKRGVALPATHGLCAAVTKHKARLGAELTKLRVKRCCPDLEALKRAVEAETRGQGEGGRRIRWVRVNAVATTVKEQMDEAFALFKRVSSLKALDEVGGGEKAVYVDEHIPNLVAVPDYVGLGSTKAYREGRIIFQDKASCFPAFLLDQPAGEGDVIDACAAPGNKTTHLAAIAHEKATATGKAASHIIACEKDALRSQTLQKMVKLAGTDTTTTIKANQNFMKLDPDSLEFANVTALLLDPSCSGSGIVGRDETSMKIQLPEIPPQGQQPTSNKKRKRTQPAAAPAVKISAPTAPEEPQEEDEAPYEPSDSAALANRLASLSEFQLRLLTHAMAFPAAKRIVYSTCSIHAQENEHVVVKALRSEVARERGWRLLRREEQVGGLRKWKLRGDLVACVGERNVSEEFGKGVAEACLRCIKGDGEGTMGFFVCGFVRDEVEGGFDRHLGAGANAEAGAEDEDEWSGFSDGD